MSVIDRSQAKGPLLSTSQHKTGPFGDGRDHLRMSLNSCTVPGGFQENNWEVVTRRLVMYIWADCSVHLSTGKCVSIVLSIFVLEPIYDP